MTKEMIISSNGHETMVAILEDDLVAEIFVERERSRGVVGNVYKGRVSKVLPGMQSSFIDVGLERDGFLYVADVIDTLEEFEKLESSDDDAPVPLAFDEHFRDEVVFEDRHGRLVAVGGDDHLLLHSQTPESVGDGPKTVPHSFFSS